MKRFLLVGVAAIAANGCGNDTGATIDAQVGSNIDARPTTTVNGCDQERVSTTIAQDGSRVEADEKFAVVVNVRPGDAFTVKTCYPNSNPVPCPAGSSCTTIGSDYPVGDRCAVTHDGSFFGDELVVVCGIRTRTFAVNGQMTSEVPFPNSTTTITY